MCDFRRLLVCLAAVAVVFAGRAVELPAIIGDNMVLQQQCNAKLWGWSKSGEAVTVTTSWNGAEYVAKANGQGRWEVAVSTPAASFEPYEITIADAQSLVTLRNVLVGEVWFCSGQSNMEMPLAGFWTQPVEGSNREIAYSGEYRGRIRMATVPKVAALEPAERVDGAWQECEPQNAAWFSAVGYFFAQSLTRMLNVPVGIINCSWGGSHVEGWLPKEVLSDYADIDIKQAGNSEVCQWDQPMIMYNGMLHPLIGYTVKGFLWNQGESNVGHHDVYAQRLARMVALWREQWQLGNVPFYMVEIPPYSYGDPEGTYAALLREAQHKSVALIENSAIVCTSDLVKPTEVEDIHASNKRPIGERLAFVAAVKTYGINGVACDSPTFKSVVVNDDGSATLHFANADEGFSPNRTVEGFEVAGADRVFHKADARVVDVKYIKVSCPQVKQIASVRYCFKNWAIGKVHNMRWLPLVPFRTDDWEK
ncbi:MAG: sialate O-acetylesterase [Muribaculaceae bacterium]